MDYAHAVELFVYLGIAVALVAFAILVVTTIEVVYGSYGLL